MITSELVELFDFARLFMSDTDLESLIAEATTYADDLVKDNFFTGTKEDIVYTLIDEAIERETAELNARLEVLEDEFKERERESYDHMLDEYNQPEPSTSKLSPYDDAPRHDELEEVA